MRIALYQPDIPQNTGNIFRLGACLGVPVDVIEPTGFIFDDKKFKRSAMDYINHLNYKRHLDWEHFLKWVKNNQGRLILMTTKSEKSYYNFKFQPSDILLFGRESAGVPNDVHDIADHRLTIPMKNEVRSINLSSSVALVIGEGLRQINGI
ncbi:MAG: tRNA (cytidine(34)-2'-O)-methyltransferase [Pelagibacteraceae bacterium]|mgnify:FL=1|jgi:tRNA (cytidine/uridine-2'-O-)-methyltransferase|nr:tRNA (cytidine(34)-2'-O)-methyltransferase [Pelagibacteraceae bacterium]MBT4646433.1 tRNA (cytidine(34)-2'-O)-methyltransferase [Pelagibacteraceae bacterium]MBT4950338.1 tRNA (cytidine(34)-2'-O)-methyltransferase [Pelagibacteraceae bacterium]